MNQTPETETPTPTRHWYDDADAEHRFAEVVAGMSNTTFDTFLARFVGELMQSGHNKIEVTDIENARLYV